MKQLLVPFLFLVTLGVELRNAPATPECNDDGKELIGAWVIKEGEAFGEKSPPEEAGKMTLIFDKDKVTWQFDTPDGKKEFEGIYKLNATKHPKEIDLSEPNNPKNIAVGIYKVERDRLTILLRKQERPKDFGDSVPVHLIFEKKRM